MQFLDTVQNILRKAFVDTRYSESAVERGFYWGLKIGGIVLGVLVVVVGIGLIYCKVKGIEVNLPF